MSKHLWERVLDYNNYVFGVKHCTETPRVKYAMLSQDSRATMTEKTNLRLDVTSGTYFTIQYTYMHMGL